MRPKVCEAPEHSVRRRSALTCEDVCHRLAQNSGATCPGLASQGGALERSDREMHRGNAESSRPHEGDCPGAGRPADACAGLSTDQDGHRSSQTLILLR